MKNEIHPSAIVSEKAHLGNGNIIDAHAIIGDDVVLGNNNFIGPGTIIQNRVIIGDNNKFKAYASIGLEGEMGTKGDRLADDAQVKIGSHNTIREFVTIHSPVRRSTTEIGDHCYIMARAHIAHDCQLDDYVVMATNSVLGGGVRVGRKAYIGLGSITHQWLDIGQFSMTGMNAVNTVHVLPFSTVVGVPSKIVGFNKVGAERNDLKNEVEEAINIGFANMLQPDFNSNNPICSSIIEFVSNRDDFKLKLR